MEDDNGAGKRVVDPASIDVDVVRTVLVVTAERPALFDQQELLAASDHATSSAARSSLATLSIPSASVTYEAGVLARRSPTTQVYQCRVWAYLAKP